VEAPVWRMNEQSVFKQMSDLEAILAAYHGAASVGDDGKSELHEQYTAIDDLESFDEGVSAYARYKESTRKRRGLTTGDDDSEVKEEVDESFVKDEGLVDWNREFQELLDQLMFACQTSPTDARDWSMVKVQCARTLGALARDFQTCAELFAKTIIREQFLPENLQVVKSVTDKLQGIAGGAKFIAHGILFKFISKEIADRLYRSYENAIKATRMDLVGCEALNDSLVTGIRAPLMSLITYR
jgi:hypothetical protein